MGVVQLVEQQIVILFVVGSSPIVHPILKKPIFTSAFFIPKFQNFLNDSKRLILQAIKSIKTFSVPSIFPKISRYFSSLVKFGYIFGYTVFWKL